MCVSLPGRVAIVDGDEAMVELAGRTVRASTLLEPETRTGDWVLVLAGAIVRRLEPDEARQVRELLGA